MTISSKLSGNAHYNSKPHLALILGDVDCLKLDNDTFGHLARDDAFRQVAQAIFHAPRFSNLVARYSGEEFATLLPDSSFEQAMARYTDLSLNFCIKKPSWKEGALDSNFW